MAYDLGQHLVDGDRGQALFLLDDAGFKLAAGAIDMVVDDAVLPPVGKPDARDIAGREDGDAGGLHGGSQVHGTAVVAEKDARRAKTAALSRGVSRPQRLTTAAPDRACHPAAAKSLASASSGAPHSASACPRVGRCDAIEQPAPVFTSPVLGLHLCPDADGDKRRASCGGEDLGRPGMLGVREVEIPARGVFKMCLRRARGCCAPGGSPPAQGSRPARSGRLLCISSVTGTPICRRHTAQPEEERIALGRRDTARCAEVDKHIRPPAEQLPPEPK